MVGMIPFNRRGSYLARPEVGFDDFYNMLDDFFTDSLRTGRSLQRDTFKIDIEDLGNEYRIDAEMPGVNKDEIDLNVEGEDLCIVLSRTETANTEEKNYIHRERRVTSMSRRVRLADANLGAIKAKLDEGILSITIPKIEKVSDSFKIAID